MSEIELKAAVARAIHEARSLIPWDVTSQQDLAFRDADIAVNAMIAFTTTPEPASNPCRLDAAVIERARAALKPFADHIDDLEKRSPGGHLDTDGFTTTHYCSGEMGYTHKVTVGDLREARATLSALDAREGG